MTLAPDEREFAYLAGRSLYMSRLNGGHTREVYRLEDGFNFGTGFSLSEDGLVSALVEEKPGLSRLRLITMRTGAATTLVESSRSDFRSAAAAQACRPALQKNQRSLWVVNYDATQNRKLHIAPGSSWDGAVVGRWKNHRLSQHSGRPEAAEQHPGVHAGYK